MDIMPRMRVVVDTDLPRFLDTVRGWLARDPVRNNVLLTVMQSRADGVEPIEDGVLLTRVMDGDAFAGVAIRTPPHALLTSGMSPDAAEALAAYLVDQAPDTLAFNGSREVAGLLAERVAAARGGTVGRGLGFGRFQLTTLIPPAPASGAPRQATVEDVDLIVRWSYAFHDDASVPEPVNPDKIRARVALGQMWLWEDGRETVCMVNRSDPAGGVARVNMVYTPKALRGRGYASSLTAYVTQGILDDGYVASLYTDLANPTSNKIYQALGYGKVDEAGIWTVTVPGDPSGT
jgi:ribosomal protein S18 acetylase RimI-like enzyme